ncbi:MULTISPECIES: hypothetical protein [Moraxella]|uniref:Uncharacterized protein n=1 Tax=Moraxella nasicaprae TaxID=2904122 RepID=A0ABY6F1S5_9GAMM|nr:MULTISPECIES: hypothetical protein [Moraxella]MDO4895067.1 hypothetical protein [Moraxella sp.]UXZ04058.1 hypothetical protein LU297_05395 [Moraxella nasicaprae]
MPIYNQNKEAALGTQAVMAGAIQLIYTSLMPLLAGKAAKNLSDWVDAT